MRSSNLNFILLPLSFWLLCCNTGDPDPIDPTDPEILYSFVCPEGIDADCPIEGTYYEVNPLYHPNPFITWTFSKESVGCPYYSSSISQISSSCDKIVLRGMNGQVQREIPIISLNDSMLIIRDEVIRPENIVLIRSQGGHYKNFYCDSTCINGCLDQTFAVEDLCGCDEFNHGWKCSQQSYLLDFSIDDYLIDAIISNNDAILVSSDILPSNDFNGVYVSSISNSGSVQWSNKYLNDAFSDYCGYTTNSNNISCVFLKESSSGDSKEIITLIIGTSGNFVGNQISASSLNKYYKFVTSIAVSDVLYVFGIFTEGGNPKLQIDKIDYNGIGQFSNIIDGLNIESTSSVSYDAQLNELNLISSNIVYKISPSSLDLLSTTTLTHYGFINVKNSTPNAPREHYDYLQFNDPEFQNKPDGVIYYNDAYVPIIYDAKFSNPKIIWTQGHLVNTSYYPEIFKNNSGSYFYYYTYQNVLHFGKYKSNLTQMEYHYIYPYITYLTNPIPRQLANGDYLFLCNTKRFGENRDILFIKFSETGLYKYPYCQ